MKRKLLACAAGLVLAPIGETFAQQQPAQRPFFVGNALGLPVEPATDRALEPMSSNVKVYGAIYSAERCSYDPDRGLIVVPNRAAPQNVQVIMPGSLSSTTTGRCTRRGGSACRALPIEPT